MRSISTAFVLTLVFVAGAAAAGDKTAAKKAAAAKGTGSGSAAGSGSGSGSAAAPAPDAGAGSGAAPAASPQVDLQTIKPEDMPTAVRMRRLEQRTQALKERAWQLKARVQMLKEQMLGGGVGAQAMITHSNDMGSSFHLTALAYSLDGTQVFSRRDDNDENLYKAKSFDIFSGPISPGNHNIAATATYQGHGYGVFEYLSKYTFTARGSNSFATDEGKIARVECRGFEKGGKSTPMEKRPAIECKATQVAPEKPAETVKPNTPGTTPVPPPSSPTPPSTPPGK